MKTRFITISAFVVALVALFACSKEHDINVGESVPPKGIPFEIVAGTLETKTANDGMATTWQAADKISLFHAEASTTSYVNDGQFDASAAGASVTFSGTLAAELTADNYDWYAIYPFVSANTTPANTGSTGYITVGSRSNEMQTQTGNNSKAHLAGSTYPVAGVVKNVAKATKPVIAMNQLTSVVAIEVTNSTAAAITVNDVSFQAPESVVGTYYIDFANSPVTYTQSGAGYVSNTARLHVASGESIAAGEKATFYLAIKPFTAAAGKTFTLSVNGSNGNQSKTSSGLESAFTFVAGKIHKLSFSYTKTVVSTESSAYETGFEDAEGFTATTSYNNTSDKLQGPTASQWGILSGSTSTTSAISGSQSLLLRDYTANAFMPYAYTSFKLSSVKEVRFKAKNKVDGYNLVLSYSSDFETWTEAKTFVLTTSAADYCYTFPTTQNNIALKFTVASSSRGDKDDVWVDNLSISKTAIVPTVSVETVAATELTSATGTTATVNGNLTLLYGAVIGDLDEAGFYYKASGAGSFSKVTCSPKPTTTAFSYDLTSLTAGTEYIFKAYAIYDGGDEVVGDELTFIPLAATSYTMSIDGNSSTGTNDVHWATIDQTSLVHNGITWNTSITGTTYHGGGTASVTIGKKAEPATAISISTEGFKGKKIISASLTGYCMSNTGPTLTITAGATEILSSQPLVKTTSTKYTSTNLSSVEIPSTGTNTLTFVISSSAAAGIVISSIEVIYTD